jgi:hypothetical protein
LIAFLFQRSLLSPRPIYIVYGGTGTWRKYINPGGFRLFLNTDCWIPQADVSWDEQGKERRQLLAGPSDRFKIIDQAEIYAVEMAMAWIDAEVVGDLTP